MWWESKTGDSRSEPRFSMQEYWDMARCSNAAYSERKCPKSTFILTLTRPVYLPIQDKENRLFHRPISSAIGTGGLDFLIANALLILRHSLFEIIIAHFCHLLYFIAKILRGHESF